MSAGSRTGGPSAGLLAAVLGLLGAQPAAAQTEVLVNGQPVEDGGTFYTPMGEKGGGNQVALFSKSDASYGVNNTGDAPLTIEDVTLEHGEGVQEEEFELLTTDLKPEPLEVEETTLEPGDQYQFKLRFYPVASGPREAVVTVTYDGGQTHEWTVVGTGRNDVSFFRHARVGLQTLLGTSKADEKATAMVADGAGNLYFSANVTMLVDKFDNDIVLGRIDADGSLGWSRIWDSGEDDRSRDPGQNAESGGSAEAMALDGEGSLYLAGKQDHGALVLKVDAETGEPVWEEYWMAGWPAYSGGSHTASDFAEAYSVDVDGGVAYVTGTTQNAVLLLALDAASGDVRWQTKLDLHDGYKDRGYAVRADGSGHLYVAGSGNNDGFVAKLSLAEDGPDLEWAKHVHLGTGGNVNSLDLDADGNLYLACDRRGAKTFFSLIRVEPDGSLGWGKTWEASSTDQNNVNVVRVIGDHVYAGGRIGIPTFDSQFGDGALLKLAREDGSTAWGAFHYNGKGPDEITEHRVKGIAEAGDSLLVFAQAYTGPKNWERFWGYWYGSPSGVVDFDPDVTAIEVDAEEQPVAMEDGAVEDVPDARKYVDGMEHFTYQEAREKLGEEGNDGDLMFWRLDPAE